MQDDFATIYPGFFLFDLSFYIPKQISCKKHEVARNKNNMVLTVIHNQNGYCRRIMTSSGYSFITLSHDPHWLIGTDIP